MLTFLRGPETYGFGAYYTGIYDFYFNSETSGPVISRLQNPGLRICYTRALAKKSFTGIQYTLDVAHESNGMFISSREQFDAVKESFPPDYIVQDFASIG